MYLYSKSDHIRIRIQIAVYKTLANMYNFTLVWGDIVQFEMFNFWRYKFRNKLCANLKEFDYKILFAIMGHKNSRG